MKNLLYAGYCLTGYSLFQLLGILIRGFPLQRTGAIALAVLGMLIILGFGVSNWCGLWYQTAGNLNKNQSLVGFAPVYVFGTAAIVALIIGMLAGG